MKKLTTVAGLGLIVLVGPIPGLLGEAAAQSGVTRIVYDQCWADAINWEVICYVGMFVDGQDVLLAYGVSPKWSPDGSRVAFTGTRYPGADEIFVMNVADGSVTNVTNNPANDSWPAWTRDGKIVFMSDRDGGSQLYVMEANGANPMRLTGGFESSPFGWSPDGRRFAFESSQDGTLELYVMDADGSNLTRLTTDVGFNGVFVWSRDGSRLAFQCADGGGDICTVNVDGTNFVRLTRDPARDSGPIFSPFGDTIAFQTDRFGTDAEIAVVNADGAVTRVTAGLGGLQPLQPIWSPDGSRLVFAGTSPSFYSGRCYLDEGVAHNADDFCMAMYDIYIFKADGTGISATVTGTNADSFMPLPGQPVAAFTSNCTGTACDFDAASSFDFDGTIATYLWQFGDGTSSSAPAVHHEYAIGNYYSVSLTVTDNSGATGVVRLFVLANVAAVASMSVACDGPTCTLDGSGSTDSDGTIKRYTWHFGDGQTGTGAIVNHTYATGTFSARLYVNDDSGTASTAVATLSVVNVPPVATFTSACHALTCTFDGSGSSDPDGTIWQYWWFFGDGTTAFGATASRTYAAAGTYTVKLTVSGNAYATATESQTVSVAAVNAPPVASFAAACGGLTCSFNASASSDPDGTIASYAWNFGDGTVGSGATASRTYPAGGAYTVMLTVTDNGGATSQIGNVAAVNAPPVASFTSECSGLTCSFNASASSDPDGTIASDAWNFGDGTVGFGATASRTYTAGGAYTVILTVTDNRAATSTQSQSVTVVPLQVHVGDLDRASTIQPTRWTATMTITAHDSSHGPIANAGVSGSWNDGSTSSCTTNASGLCTVSRSGILKKTTSVSFTVTNVARATFVYKPANNHDPDGDSNGTSVTVSKP